jgi:hypothetical protein
MTNFRSRTRGPVTHATRPSSSWTILPGVRQSSHNQQVVGRVLHGHQKPQVSVPPSMAVTRSCRRPGCSWRAFSTSSRPAREWPTAALGWQDHRDQCTTRPEEGACSPSVDPRRREPAGGHERPGSAAPTLPSRSVKTTPTLVSSPSSPVSRQRRWILAGDPGSAGVAVGPGHSVSRS